jgi:hypothetical protein
MRLSTRTAALAKLRAIFVFALYEAIKRVISDEPNSAEECAD